MSGKTFILRFAWSTVVVLVAIVAIMGILIYKRIYSTNLVVASDTKEFLYIPTGSNFYDVISILKKQNLLLNEKSFLWTARQMNYERHVKPGRYHLNKKMTNKELLVLLRSGRQTPVNVTFNNIRTKEQFVERIGEQIEVSPQALLNLISDSDYTDRLGFTSENVLTMFLPDTYEFYWNTSADKFLLRMKREYDKFWTSARLSKAQKINLSPIQVSILASIVQMESNKEDEKPIIAGVYLNRYKKDWKLEADPTLVWALGNFSIARVLTAYKKIESPYNTYKYKGLPPGPICLPSSNSIDAVLNYVPHKYMYFCAKDDFSGYHSFAVTYFQHIINARKFQRALDRRGIGS